MRFTQISAVALLSSAVSAQATYSKGKAGVNKQDANGQYIPGRFIVEFAKPEGFSIQSDVSPSPPCFLVIWKALANSDVFLRIAS